MAGGTSCFRVTVGEGDALVKELISYHPKYAHTIDAAIEQLQKKLPAIVAPTDWQRLVMKWEGQRE
mgnify:CR=1 FL=1